MADFSHFPSLQERFYAPPFIKDFISTIALNIISLKRDIMLTLRQIHFIILSISLLGRNIYEIQLQ